MTSSKGYFLLIGIISFLFLLSAAWSDKAKWTPTSSENLIILSGTPIVDKVIDFLYLDSLDGQFEGASFHQLEEIKIAKKNLKKDSLVLLDDKGDKTNLSIDYMLRNDFKIINYVN